MLKKAPIARPPSRSGPANAMTRRRGRPSGEHADNITIKSRATVVCPATSRARQSLAAWNAVASREETPGGAYRRMRNVQEDAFRSVRSCSPQHAVAVRSLGARIPEAASTVVVSMAGDFHHGFGGAGLARAWAWDWQLHRWPYGYGYPSYAYYDGGCYLAPATRWTPWGWRFRSVEVCD